MRSERPHIDYDEIAGSYDDHRTGEGPYVERLINLADSPRVGAVVDLGCGTGNVMRLLARACQCSFIGVDHSAQMLVRARQKGLPAYWIRGNIQRLPIAADAADGAYGCFVLQHIRDMDAVMGECARVVRPGGFAAFVTSPHSFFARHPMAMFFPSMVSIEEARFPREEEIARALDDAGFADVETEYRESEPRPIDHDFVERVANRYISTYRLIPELEFYHGLSCLQAELQDKPRLDMEMVWEVVTVWGRRPQ